MEKSRPVLLSIETLVEILKDYMGEDDLPSDAKAVKLMMNPQEANKIGLVVESSQIKYGAAPLEVRFDIRRMFGVS